MACRVVHQLHMGYARAVRQERRCHHAGSFEGKDGSVDDFIGLTIYRDLCMLLKYLRVPFYTPISLLHPHLSPCRGC